MTLLRKLDDNASSIGVMLILIPVILMIVMTLVSVYGLSGDATVGIQGIVQLPDGYDSMTKVERIDWLNSQHGGTVVHYTYNVLGVYRPYGTAHLNYYEFPDGLRMTESEFNHFVDGNEEEGISVATVLFNFLTVNIPMLHLLGFFGVCLRLLFACCVIIGIVDIIWIG